MANVIVRIDGKVLCNPAEANTFDEVFNSANVDLCIDQSSIDGFTQAFTQNVWGEYSAAEHAMGAMLVIGKATSWTLHTAYDVVIGGLF